MCLTPPLCYSCQKCKACIESTQTQIEEHSAKSLVVISKMIKEKKNKERLWNCPNFEETDETQQPNPMWEPGLDPGPEKGH